MRVVATAIASLVLISACGSTTAVASHRTSAPPSATASASASAAASGSAAPSASTAPGSPTPISPLTGQYGLLIAGGKLELIKGDATVFASTPIADSSVQFCSSNHDGAVLAPPVSASSDQVYFRDGDTRIREVAPPSSAVDVTTVPGGASVVSFFSVSPDDKRIAVLVEDLSAASTISLRLYVEDLAGHGHHADIYSTSFAKGKSGATLWPMGWHAGALVLALITACAFEPGFVASEWHVSNASTAVRLATVKSNNCVLSFFPSPAGVGCSGPGGTTTTYGWDGKVVSVTGPGVPGFDYAATALSPAGNSILFSIRFGIGSPPPATQLVQLGPGPYATVQGHSGCLWIDEDHVLAPDAVIQFPAETGGNVRVNTTVTPLPQSGICEGRFPGGL